MIYENETVFDCDGLMTLLIIAHGLDKIPYTATTKIKGTKNKYFLDFDKTNLTIVFQTPPIGKIIVKWNVRTEI